MDSLALSVLLRQAFIAECTTLINEAKAPELIRKLLEHRNAVLAFDKEGNCGGVLLRAVSLLT